MSAGWRSENRHPTSGTELLPRLIGIPCLEKAGKTLKRSGSEEVLPAAQLLDPIGRVDDRHVMPNRRHDRHEAEKLKEAKPPERKTVTHHASKPSGEHQD